MIYIVIFFIYYVGVGAYFASLSPFILTVYKSDANLVFLASQAAFPFGYFLSGYLSDRFRSLRTLLVPFILFQFFFQYLLFIPYDSLLPAIAVSAATRFCFAFNFQLLTIAALEGGGMKKFGIYRSYGTGGFFFVQLLLFLLDGTSVFQGLEANAKDAALAGQLGAFFYLLVFLLSFFIQKERVSQEKYNFMRTISITLKPGMLLFYAFSFFYYFSYQIVDFYVGNYFRLTGGMKMVYLGWFLAVILEIPFLPLSARVFHFHRGRFLFLVSTLAGTLRFGLLALHASGQEEIPVLYTQILHGIQFTGYYMGGIHLMRKAYPEHLYGTGYGLFMIFAVSLGGMAGNLFFGKVLYGGFNFDGAFSFLNIAEGFPSLFLLASSIQLLLFFVFLTYSKKENTTDKKIFF